MSCSLARDQSVLKERGARRKVGRAGKSTMGSCAMRRNKPSLDRKEEDV